MSVLTAVVVLAWGCLTVLTLAMAGMLRQLRELQTEVSQLRVEPGTQPWRATMGRRLAELADMGPLVLLVLDPGCSLCEAVHEPFARLADEHPAVRFEVLSPRVHRTRQHSADAASIRSRVDPQLVAELDLPWAPALLHASHDGTVLAAQPVTSAERVGEQVAALLSTAIIRQGGQ